MSKHYYLLRPKPGGTDRIKEFLERNICAIGWSNIGDIRKIKKSDTDEKLMEDYRIAVLKAYSDWKEKQAWRIVSSATSINTFVNIMKKEDILIMPVEDTIYFAKITGDYYFEEKNQQEDYANQRTVSFLKKVKRENLPEKLKNALKVRYIIANFDDYQTEIEETIGRDEAKVELENFNKMEYEAITYPIRPGVYAKVQIP